MSLAGLSLLAVLTQVLLWRVRCVKLETSWSFVTFLKFDHGPSWLMTLKHLDCVVRLVFRVLDLLAFTSVTY